MCSARIFLTTLQEKAAQSENTLPPTSKHTPSPPVPSQKHLHLSPLQEKAAQSENTPPPTSKHTPSLPVPSQKCLCSSPHSSLKKQKKKVKKTTTVPSPYSDLLMSPQPLDGQYTASPDADLSTFIHHDSSNLPPLPHCLRTPPYTNVPSKARKQHAAPSCNQAKVLVISSDSEPLVSPKHTHAKPSLRSSKHLTVSSQSQQHLLLSSAPNVGNVHQKLYSKSKKKQRDLQFSDNYHCILLAQCFKAMAHAGKQCGSGTFKVEDIFQAHFPQVLYKSSMVGGYQKCWNLATPAQKLQFKNYEYEDEGLWSNFCKIVSDPQQGHHSHQKHNKRAAECAAYMEEEEVVVVVRVELELEDLD
ncbi:hypothetical protein Moror_14708 [Moniliophthora roreri MCA 2997]|uniref:Uncharacterized protein n=1 Tax=Moniliophthora roreri (strain MCA 2997) TaxID=1381753 RepID=V2Y9S8_MONRO|nr:hypothetical protein Moror_14708 [Moniliophthora roreri MCA 2997]